MVDGVGDGGTWCVGDEVGIARGAGEVCGNVAGLVEGALPVVVASAGKQEVVGDGVGCGGGRTRLIVVRDG